MRHLFTALTFIAVLFLSQSFAPNSFAQGVKDPACLEKLSDRGLYKKHKKESYALLVPGEDDWLFRSESDFKQDFAFTSGTVAGFAQLTKSLKARGTDLVIAFPPTRGIMAAKYLPADVSYDSAAALASYKALIKTMRAEGIHFVGVTNFEQDGSFFRKQDHHWTVKGARQTASDVADYIRSEISSYKKIEKKAFETTSSGTYQFRNRFDDVVNALCGVSIPNSSDSAVSTALKGQGADDLFSDETPPDIILVGTSNSKAANVKSNFSGALRDLLQADVMNEALSGAGFDQPLLAFLNSERFQTNPPKIIIWEVPGNYTLKGMSEFFNQAIATSAGDCAKKAIASFGPVKLTEESTLLKEGFQGRKLKNGRDYLYLSFDQPVKKKFGIKFGYDDSSKSKKSFKFKPSKHYPDQNNFFTVSPITKRDTIDALYIRVPNNILNSNVEGRFCRLPKGVTGVKY